ncbi:MAG: biotin--[acetyl-CoA-carboxylase] ligase [Thermoplasmatota archaeon]
MDFRIERFASLPSTMDLARERAEGGAAEGIVIRADVQTSGRGRLGRAWVSPQGGLWFTLILRPHRPPTDWGPVSLIAGCAIHAAIENAGVACRLKWPNDIMIDEKKVAGILAESKAPAWVLVGVGVNTALPPDEQRGLPPEAQALPLAAGDAEAFLPRCLAELATRFRLWEADRDGSATAHLLHEWEERAQIHGVAMTRAGVRGIARGLAPDGALVLEGRDGKRHLIRD